MVCGVSPAVSPVAALRSLARQLSERAWVVSIKVIETARVPVIKALAALPPSSAALCEGSQLQLDVSGLGDAAMRCPVAAPAHTSLDAAQALPRSGEKGVSPASAHLSTDSNRCGWMPTR